MRARAKIRRRRNAGLGFIPAAAAPVIAGSGPAAPIVAAVLAGAAIFAKVFNLRFGPDPRKVPDTKLVEAAGEAFSDIWYAAWGEKLPWNMVPGPGGSYAPDEFDHGPYGRGGNPQVDMERALSALEATYLEARQYLLRPESLPNLDNLYAGWRGRLKFVRQQRAAQPLQTSAILPAGIWPWAIAGIFGLLALQEAA